LENSNPFPYPAPGSMTIAEASKWYLDFVPRISGVVPDQGDEDWVPHQNGDGSRLEQAWNIKSRLRLAAALALFDQELVSEFFEAFPLPTIKELLQRSRASNNGKPSHRVGLDLLVAVSEKELTAFPGTLGESIGAEVHIVGGGTYIVTEDGLEPKG
jgi:hypothetical protein